MPRRVAVIGAGPAGLAAAHAATGLGALVRIIAPYSKTLQLGPLLIQRPIPGINTEHPDGTIHQLVIGGSILDYRYKLYGDVNIGINGDVLQPSYHAWHHSQTYDALWRRYHTLITDGMISPLDLSTLHEQCDLVVSTANAEILCFQADKHRFHKKVVAITNAVSYPEQPDNTIIFNAFPSVPWVRSSKIFGTEVTEWTVDQAPPMARMIQKPISTDCDCYPKVLRTGRFGAWRNETWVDTAYWDTYTALETMTRRSELEHIR